MGDRLHLESLGRLEPGSEKLLDPKFLGYALGLPPGQPQRERYRHLLVEFESRSRGLADVLASYIKRIEVDEERAKPI